MDILPEDRVLPTYDSDVCAQVQVLKDTFTMEYARTLKFQTVPEDSEPVFEEPSMISGPESDQVLKGSLLFFR